MQEGRLVKTTQFADPVYVGDPVNVLSIFNDFEVDEIAILDIGAARSRRPAALTLLANLAEECFIPLTYGGGLETADQMREVLAIGFEKIVVNTAIALRQDEVRAGVDALGSQAIVAAIDVRRVNGRYEVCVAGGTQSTGIDPRTWAELACQLGVGELLVTSIDREGTREGFDLDLIQLVTSAVGVPVIAHGGAHCREDLALPVLEAGAAAVGAGSLFVFQGPQSSVLINYPRRTEIVQLFGTGGAHQAAAGEAEPMSLRSAAPLRRASMSSKPVVTCVRCLYHAAVPGIGFDATGLCNYCRLHDEMEEQYPTGERGAEELGALANEIRRAGHGKRYDCILGVSGGCDSSFLAHKMVELGLRPLAVHFDNTWNSPIATANIYSVLEKLTIDLETYVVDNREYDDIYRAFMLAGVRDIEAPTDIGFMGVLYRAAAEHDIQFIVEGHSFRTEGISPLGWLYMDGGYIKSVHERFGRVPMRTFPNMEFRQFVRWAALSGIKRIRPLYYLDYDKERTKRFLTDTYGWEWYGGHHLENRFTGFYHTYFLPERFGIDFRLVEYSALVRSNQLSREVAAKMLEEPRQPDLEIIAMVKKRLDFSDEEFAMVMTGPKHTYRDYPTYKQRFERLRWFFWLMYKLDRVPKSFYVKFCLPGT